MPDITDLQRSSEVKLFCFYLCAIVQAEGAHHCYWWRCLLGCGWPVRQPVQEEHARHQGNDSKLWLLHHIIIPPELCSFVREGRWSGGSFDDEEPSMSHGCLSRLMLLLDLFFSIKVSSDMQLCWPRWSDTSKVVRSRVFVSPVDTWSLRDKG